MSQRLRFVKPLALAALLAGLVSCGTSVDAPQLGAGDARIAQSPASASTMNSFHASSPTAGSSAMATSTSPTTALAPSRGLADASEYQITPTDVLQISIFQVRDLDRTVQVDGSGSISLPLVGRVPVQGKTILQAQNDITAR